MRWLIPTPVCPAMHAGNHPPLGVTDTTQPLLSAASILVVPRQSLSIYRLSGVLFVLIASVLLLSMLFKKPVVSCLGKKRLPFLTAPVSVNAALSCNSAVNGLVALW